MTFNRALGELLKELREEHRMSQAQLAKKIEVHPNTVSNFERGQGSMPIGLFMQLCAVLGVEAGKVLQRAQAGTES